MVDIRIEVCRSSTTKPASLSQCACKYLSNICACYILNMCAHDNKSAPMRHFPIPSPPNMEIDVKAKQRHKIGHFPFALVICKRLGQWKQLISYALKSPSIVLRLFGIVTVKESCVCVICSSWPTSLQCGCL